ncbi:MAG: acyl-CoA thioesterase [Limnohabitans sp.]|nr:acyl-CoA thioesterase [Limnohabitans sp.]
MNLPSHQMVMTLLMTPDMANFSGNVHGGTLLKLLDEVAYACASRYAGTYVVTMSVDQVIFKEPVHIGEIVNLMASINRTGRTSMEVGVKVVAENIQTQQLRHVNSCYLTMVAMDADKKPIAVKPFIPKTPDEIRRHDEAEKRIELRKTFKNNTQRGF